MASHLTEGLFTLPPQSEQSKAVAAARALMKKGGYAALPGSGPAGETCKSCKHLDHTGNSGRYLKCALTRAKWTHGPGTDIKAGSPACAKWEPHPLDIATAPKDGTWIQAKIPGHGSDNQIAWVGGLLNSAGEDCGGWQFMGPGEPPDSWTDGVCWEVNEDGKPSVQPTEWRPA